MGCTVKFNSPPVKKFPLFETDIDIVGEEYMNQKVRYVLESSHPHYIGTHTSQAELYFI